MTTTYAHVTDGTVDRVGLPDSGFITDADGDRVGVSGFDLLPADTLKAEGWLPMVDEPPAYNETTQALTITGYDVGADTVTTTYEVTALPPTLTASTYTAAAGDVVTITYADATDTAPAAVTFTVNGATATVDLTDAVAELDVTMPSSGDVTVTVAGVAALTIRGE